MPPPYANALEALQDYQPGRIPEGLEFLSSLSKKHLGEFEADRLRFLNNEPKPGEVLYALDGKLTPPEALRFLMDWHATAELDANPDLVARVMR